MSMLQEVSNEIPVGLRRFSPSRLFMLGASGLVVILSLTCAIQCISETGEGGASPLVLPALIYGVSLWLWWLPWIAALALLRRYPRLAGISVPGIAFQAAVGTLLMCTHLELLQWTVKVMMQHWPRLGQDGYQTLVFMTPGRASLDLLFYAALWLTHAALSSQADAQQDAIIASRLREELAESKLTALQMQVAPHFLLNTLNAITGLIEIKRHEEASAMLRNLNAMLRTTLTSNPAAKVTVAQELETVASYLAIEQARFADRLRIETCLAPDAADGLIPSFLLQPLVENSIRHGISQVEENGLIQTSCVRAGNRLLLRVRDNGPGPGSTSEPGHGIGLGNVRQRLSLFYRTDYSLQMSEPEGGGCEVAISLPYERRFA